MATCGWVPEEELVGAAKLPNAGVLNPIQVPKPGAENMGVPELDCC